MMKHAASTSEDFFSAEAHRIRAAVLLDLDPDDFDAARRELVTARELASEQGARVFELRAALDLAELVHDDLVTHAWVDDPVRWLLARVSGYRR